MSSSQINIINKITTALKSFSNKELVEIIISSLAISVMISLNDFISGKAQIIRLITGFVTVLISLLVHHFAHKFFAQKYDCTTNFKISYNLLLIGLILSLLTNSAIIFAAPGAIAITSAYFTRIGYKYVNITNREKGIIALSGPLSNILLAIISLALYSLNPAFFQELINVNIFFAIFNMIPIPPLDGNNIFWWNRMIWAVGLLIPLFMFFFAFNILFALIGSVLILIITFILWQTMYS